MIRIHKLIMRGPRHRPRSAAHAATRSSRAPRAAGSFLSSWSSLVSLLSLLVIVSISISISISTSTISISTSTISISISASTSVSISVSPAPRGRRASSRPPRPGGGVDRLLSRWWTYWTWCKLVSSISKELRGRPIILALINCRCNCSLQAQSINAFTWLQLLIYDLMIASVINCPNLTDTRISLACQ